MATVIRIGVLSIATAVYIMWAFRGLEYDLLETGPPLLQLIAALIIPTAIAWPVYSRVGQHDDAQVARFAFLFWLASTAVISVAYVILFGSDAAAAGYFRDNLIVGVVGLIILIGVLNFVTIRVLDYFAPKRR